MPASPFAFVCNAIAVNIASPAISMFSAPQNPFGVGFGAAAAGDADAANAVTAARTTATRLRARFIEPPRSSCPAETFTRRTYADSGRRIADEIPRFCPPYNRAIDPSVGNELVDALEQAAVDAAEKSGFAVAGHLFDRAARAASGGRGRRLLVRAAEAFVIAGELDEAERVLGDPAFERSRDAATRTKRVRLLAAVARARGEPSAGELLHREAEAVAGRADGAGELLLEAAISDTAVGRWGSAVDAASRAAKAGRDDPLRSLVVDAIHIGAGRGEPRDPAELEADLLDGTRSANAADFERLLYASFPLIDTGEFARARRVLDGLLDRARAVRANAVVPDVLQSAGIVDFREGRWRDAEVALDESIRLAAEARQRLVEIWSLAWRGLIEAAAGRERECRATVARASREAELVGAGSTPLLEARLGLLELTLGRPARALEHPGRSPSHAADWIEAAIRVGEVDLARTALERLEAEERLNPRVAATLARCHGLIATDSDFEREFARAFELLDRRPDAFQRARTELCLGERRRRAGRRVRAREPLREALEAFRELGAWPWAERARRELGATGARVPATERPGLHELTSQELAVARAVADGASNREAAVALYLSRKTIEFHLRNAYRKLGVRSRGELAARLRG